MSFGKTIKDLRRKENITQDEMAEKLNISRQAISNWENDRNLPDIEMLIIISKTFNISLDNLILEGDNMSNITKKLINDSSENKRAKLNLYSIIVGAFLLLISIICGFIKETSVEYIDNNGILHENFYLIPIAYLFALSGFIVITISCIKYLIVKNKK